MQKFIYLGHVRIDVDSIEAYIPDEVKVGDNTKFQVHLYRRNIDAYMALTFSTEQVRNECLNHLDSVFKLT
jgi:hypothetical protein